MNVKDRLYNREVREVRRRSPHWRMRSLSEEGRDNITHPERGPLGTGGDALAGDPHTVAGIAARRVLRRFHPRWEGQRLRHSAAPHCRQPSPGGSARRPTGRERPVIRDPWAEPTPGLQGGGYSKNRRVDRERADSHAGSVAPRSDARKPASVSGTGTRTARFGARSRLYGNGDKARGVWGAPAERYVFPRSCIEKTVRRPSLASATSR